MDARQPIHREVATNSALAVMSAPPIGGPLLTAPNDATSVDIARYFPSVTLLVSLGYGTNKLSSLFDGADQVAQRQQR